MKGLVVLALVGGVVGLVVLGLDLPHLAEDAEAGETLFLLLFAEEPGPGGDEPAGGQIYGAGRPQRQRVLP